jgi:tetratricopeptide (TPR) repeat protein
MIKSSKGSCMSKSVIPAVAAAVALLAGSATGAWAAEAKNTVSKAAAKTLKAAQDASNAKNYGECVNKGKEVLATAAITPFDKYVANQLLAFCYARQNNTEGAVQALEAQLDSGFMPAEQQNPTIKQLAVIAYNAKNFPKAVDLGNRLIKAGAGDAETYTVVGQALYQQGKFSEAGKFLADYVKDVEAKGQQPKETTLVLLRGAYDRANNNAGATDALEKLVMYYPKKEYWKNLMYTVRRMQGMNDRQTLQVYRLMVANQTMEECSDYSEMAELAVSGGNPGEAQKVFESALAANVCTEQREKDRIARLLESVKKSAATDQASLPKIEKEAATAKTGDVDAALGNAYLSYGQNDKAIEAFGKALSKGGLKNAADVQLTQGVAYVRAGNKAEALKAFKAVKSDDPVYARLAKLWSLHVQ